MECGGLVIINDRDSRVAVVHGCFAEGDDSILSSLNSLRSLCIGGNCLETSGIGAGVPRPARNLLLS